MLSCFPEINDIIPLIPQNPWEGLTDVPKNDGSVAQSADLDLISRSGFTQFAQAYLTECFE